MKNRALIIGCGNIGGLYDINDVDRVWTHAKALSKTRGWDFAVSDVNEEAARKVALAYNVKSVDLSSNPDLSSFNLVCLATPTSTHYEYLQVLLKQEVPVIICEKPVVGQLGEADKILRLYEASRSKVLVNYIRRFQPAYIQLKKNLQRKLEIDSCKGINIKYQKGLLNNGSHAFDLIEFLFNAKIRFDLSFSRPSGMRFISILPFQEVLSCQVFRCVFLELPALITLFLKLRSSFQRGRS